MRQNPVATGWCRCLTLGTAHFGIVFSRAAAVSCQICSHHISAANSKPSYLAVALNHDLMA